MTEPLPQFLVERSKAILTEIQKGKLTEAKLDLESFIKEASLAKNKEMEALGYSLLGMMHRSQKEDKQAWRAYEKAEKLMPEDPSLKIILARFLLDVFRQHDTVIKKMTQVLELAKDNPTFLHYAQSVLGLAYLHKGKKEMAIECFKNAMEDHFENLSSAMNIDFSLFEALIDKKLALDECRLYLTRALAFAQKKGEQNSILIFTRMVEIFPVLTQEIPTSEG